ncbi:superoxide dismutase [Annulohypoxylon maeteangense]|uniref:superoxide dismutase n=1 Tax=Annulohypoxylon maeteangense TaxID=1927788 RepID=UPI002008886A|nr:superoxide dismutase [Annulohypoxylon maeteangense]KAI0889145.1 superoxide dismutase [Annulohypoxylon maeteangense]
MRVLNLITLSAIGTSSVFAQSNNVTGKLGDAPATSGNPAGKIAIATLPEDAFWGGSINGNVRGHVAATSGVDGNGIDYEVSFSNLPTEGGPFIYHIHVAPVPSDGNCTSTLAHLDQTIRGEDPACDPARPASCQQGDLSGKYGKINGSAPFAAKFHDPYTSLVEGDGAYFGNRSLVFHFNNKTRISCANFSVLSSNTTSPYPTGSSPAKSSPTASTIPVTGAGAALGVVRNLAFAPVVVAFFALL